MRCAWGDAIQPVARAEHISMFQQTINLELVPFVYPNERNVFFFFWGKDYTQKQQQIHKRSSNWRHQQNIIKHSKMHLRETILIPSIYYIYLNPIPYNGISCHLFIMLVFFNDCCCCFTVLYVHHYFFFFSMDVCLTLIYLFHLVCFLFLFLK